MANPRRTSYANNQLLPISSPENPNSQSQFQFQFQTPQTAATALFTSLKNFLKKPHAFPFLLSIFLFLTWVSLRYQHSYNATPSSRFSSVNMEKSTVGGGLLKDSNANLVKFAASSSLVMKDKRGWLIDPVSLALDANLPGGAVSCKSVHMGEVRPGTMRGNHRHHDCNETLVIWGAKTVYRLENKAVAKGYSEVVIGADEVAVAASPSGTAHALMNIDGFRTTFFLGCQDSLINYNSSTSDFKVWKDLS